MGNENLNKRIGAQLKFLREERNMSLKEFAQLCNRKKDQMEDIENGVYSLTIDDLDDICLYLGVTLGAFFGEENFK